MYRHVKSKYCHVSLAEVVLIKLINSAYLQKYGVFSLSVCTFVLSSVEYCRVWFLLYSSKSTDCYKSYGFIISKGLRAESFTSKFLVKEK